MDMSAAASSANPAVGIIVAILAILAYWLPSIVAVIRRVPNIGSVIVVDMLLGWTVIGWIVALAMAFRSKPPPAPPWTQSAQWQAFRPPPQQGPHP